MQFCYKSGHTSVNYVVCSGLNEWRIGHGLVQHKNTNVDAPYKSQVSSESDVREVMGYSQRLIIEEGGVSRGLTAFSVVVNRIYSIKRRVSVTREMFYALHPCTQNDVSFYSIGITR